MKQICLWSMLFSALLLFGTMPAGASENIPITIAPQGQFAPRGVSDGVGGTVIIWEDFRTGKDWDVYAQRLNVDGIPLWTEDGVAICERKRDQRWLRMVRNEAHIIIAWTDQRAPGNWDVYAQIIDLSGKKLMLDGDAPVCTDPADQSDIEILSDGSGGAIIVWKDRRQHPDFHDLYVQRIDGNGQPMWELNGIPVFLSEALQSTPRLVSGGGDSFYVVWWEVVGYEQWNIVAHRIGMDGKHLWREPTVISPMEGLQGEPRAVSDGQGGLIVVWQIYENFINDDFYAQRIDPSGNKIWQENGVPICDAEGIQKNLTITSDEYGGAVAVWRDERDVFSDLYVQRIGADGTPRWKRNGIPLCIAGGYQDKPFLTRCGENEFFVAWLDFREDYDDKSSDSIYGQKINLEGKTLWAENGIPLCTADGVQQPPYVAASESGQLSVVWSDARSDIGDIYMHRVK